MPLHMSARLAEMASGLAATVKPQDDEHDQAGGLGQA